MVCLKEQQSQEEKITIKKKDKAYFQSQTYINLEDTNVKKKLYLR